MEHNRYPVGRRLGILAGFHIILLLTTHEAIAAQGRDSSGVRLVEYPTIPTAMPTLSVSATADPRIGVVEGAKDFIFARIGTLDLRSDGGVVITEEPSRQVRAFSEGGQHLWTAGGGGGGPGEFNRLIGLVRIRGDTVLAIGDDRRVRVFGEDGRYIRDLDVTSPFPTLAFPTIVGAMNDGTLVGVLHEFSRDTDGYQRPTFVLAYFDSEGAYRSQAGTFSGQELVRRRQPPLSSGSIVTSSVTLQMFRKTVVAVGSQQVVVGDQARFELLFYDRSGRLMRIVRVLEPAKPLDRRRYLRFHEERDRRCPTGCWWDAALPETLPAFARIFVDMDRRVWVQEFVPEYEARTPYWWVLNPEGLFLGRVNVPQGFTLLQAEGNYVWGTRQDDLLVTYVERRTLGRPSR